MLEQITPLILTYNEAPNIERTLARLGWASRIVVVDSYSQDETLEILSRYPQVEVFYRKFDSFADQCNFGLEKVSSEWVLSLDADYVLSESFVDELKTLDFKGHIVGYTSAFTTCVVGWPLKGGLYPPRTVLYRRSKAVYQQDGHAHRVSIDGPTTLIRSLIFHDDRKSFNRWLMSQDRYCDQEAEKLVATSLSELPLQDKLRKMILPAPLVMAFYTLLWRGMIFQGWAGWYYVFQRVLAEMILSLKMIEKTKLNPSSKVIQQTGETSA